MSIKQTIYKLPRKYQRIYKDGAWSPFTSTDMKTSLYMTDRIGEERTPIVSKIAYPIFDKFGNLGLYDFPKRISVNKKENDGVFFEDRLTKITG